MGEIGTPCRHDVPFGMQIHDSRMKKVKSAALFDQGKRFAIHL